MKKQNNNGPPTGRLRHQYFRNSWDTMVSAACVALFLIAVQASAVDLRFELVKLPALRINGQAARAHTQGLEVLAGTYYVTARRDDVLPKKALLLRTTANRTDWDVWDITPETDGDTETVLDHPGGFQSDGNRLWIPLAESKRKGRSLIRVFPITSLVPGRPLKSEFEFPVSDHIGAVAVSAEQKLALGASWNTEEVYVWDLQGRIQRILGQSELESRGLGVVRDSKQRAGLAVQDWKIMGDRLYASGLYQGPNALVASRQSQLLSFARFLEPEFQRRLVILPKQDETELAREGMAVSGGLIHYIPEDLGASNQIFRAPITSLEKRSVKENPQSSDRP